MSSEHLNLSQPFQNSKGNKPYKCSLCNKAFTRKHTLSEHIKGIHLGQKPYKCSLCDKAFAGRQALNRHIRIHSEEKTFKCNFCDRVFRRKYDFKNHERTHTGEKPYICLFCRKMFAHSSYMAVHSRIHRGERPYKCNLCNKTFAYKQYMNQHTRSHSGVKPYKCSMCGKAFTDRQHLKRHTRTHSREEPFRCHSCGKAFARKCDVEAHGKSLKHTGKSLNCVLFCKKLLSQASDGSLRARTPTGEEPYSTDREKHMRCHTVEDLCKCDLCRTACARNGDAISHTEDISNRLPSRKYKHDGCSSRQRSSISSEDNRTVDENTLPLLDHHLTVYPNANQFFLRAYGCGLCDETFDIEKEFADHCHNHFCYDPQKETFLDLFEIRLPCYFRCKQETD